jgi:hypothetical protein
MFLYTHPVSCKIGMSCVKYEMGCLTGWVAVMFLTSMAEEIARTEPSRCGTAASRTAMTTTVYHASKTVSFLRLTKANKQYEN